MPLAICKVFKLKSLNLVRILVVSHCLTKDRLTGRKFWKMTKEKTEELQNSAWCDERFDREWLYACVQLFLWTCA